MKSDYLSHVDNEYDKALEACAGVLVNNAGREQRVDGYSLFTGTNHRADKYASEELKEFWEAHPRVSLMDYELQWMTGQLEFIGAN
jgi:hypothetical protein